MKTIGLCMIVKNEAAVIVRCLDSVRPLIDYVLIEDTGSSDGTQEIIRDYLCRHEIAGEVFDEPWQDFATNRTLALARLRERSDVDYALIMDADDRLVFDDGFDPRAFKEGLTADLYNVWIRLGGVRYHRPQICSNRLGFHFRGVVHEFLQGPSEYASATADGFHIAAGVEGARSNDPDKYRKDAEAIERALLDETDPLLRSRYTFYMAQSWRDGGEKEKSLENYLKRAELGFWDEEIYVSLYNAGRLQAALGRPYDEIIATYLRASELLPRRAEALHSASFYCRSVGKNREGYEFAKRGLAIPEPTGGLFVEGWIYQYGLLDELAINGYWAGEYQASLEACERLLSEGKIPDSMRERIGQNAGFAKTKLESEPPPAQPVPEALPKNLPGPPQKPMPPATIATVGDNTQAPLGQLIQAAFDEAMAGNGKIDPMLPVFEGAPGLQYRMSSGRKYRLFINNLVRSLSEPRYLEIGCFSGSTLCAAVADNNVRALAIDNWSQFGGPVSLFMKNTANLRGPDTKISVLESDYRDIDYRHIGKFNIYMFDGPHTDRDHYDSIHLAQPALDENFVLIVDDWDWDQVREGTFRALEACGLRIDFAIDVRTTLDSTTPDFGGEWSDWHNGYFLAAISNNRGTASVPAPARLPAAVAVPSVVQLALPPPALAARRADAAEPPLVLLAILAKQKETVLPLYLACVEALDYPKSSIVLYVRTNNNTDRTAELLQDWLGRVGARYAEVIFDGSDVPEPVQKFGVHEWNPMRFKVLAKIRQDSMAAALERGCDFYFVVDVDNFVLPKTLRELVGVNLPIVAPLLRHQDPNNSYANYHEKIDANGYFAHSDAYYAILEQRTKGLIQVPVVHCTYLVRADAIPRLKYDDQSGRYEYVIFSDSARRNRVPQYLDNRAVYGYLSLNEECAAAAKFVGPEVWPRVIAASGQPRLVYCCGLQSSGSTWMYNLVREMCRAQGWPVASLYADSQKELPWETLPNGVIVVKSHAASGLCRAMLVENGIPLIMTVRDPRDAVVSFINRFNVSFDHALAVVTNSAAVMAAFPPNCTEHVYLYEDGFVGTTGTFDRIAGLLGVTFSPEQRDAILAGLTPEGVKAVIDGLTAAGVLREGKPDWDSETQWHRAHVGDGRIGKYREHLTPEQEQRILRQTEAFCRRFGYDAPADDAAREDAAAAKEAVPA